MNYIYNIKPEECRMFEEDIQLIWPLVVTLTVPHIVYAFLWCKSQSIIQLCYNVWLSPKLIVELINLFVIIFRPFQFYMISLTFKYVGTKLHLHLLYGH